MATPLTRREALRLGGSGLAVLAMGRVLAGLAFDRGRFWGEGDVVMELRRP